MRLTIAVDRDTWQASLARCYQGVKSVCPVSGEPTRENIEKQYGAEFLYQEAVNDTYPAALVEAIGQSDIQIAGTPTLTVEEIGADGYTFAAVIDLYPEVQLGQYKGLSAVYPEVELTSDDTEAALEEYARANPHVEHPDRAAMGDEVVLDFEGFVDGVAFEGGKGEQYPLLLGSGYFIPGFEEQVAGAAVGEERDVNVTFPTEYVPELAGKDAVFRIKVHQITRRSLPEWNDDFARQQGFADVSALRRAVMEAAVQKKQTQAAEQFANDLIRQVTSAMTVTIPDAMVENQLDGLINELRGHLQTQGVSLEQYLEAGNTTMEQLSSMMVGRDVSFHVEKKPAQPGEVVLDVSHMTVASKMHKNNAVKDVSLQVRRGEIVCLAGIDGNGQTEFVYGLTGLEPVVSGKITLNGQDITKMPIRKRNIMGMSHIPEDRHKHGLVLDYSLEDNLVLERYFEPEFTDKAGFLRRDNIRKYAEKLIEQYDVRSGQGPVTIARSMSGGNQQKAIVAREIDKDPELLVAVQPTRGLDVGAIEYIHRQLVAQRDEGKAVLLVSLELDEVMDVPDRILVMYEGEIVGELDPKKTTQEELGLYMAGAKRDEVKA